MVATYLDDIVAYHRARVASDHRDWQERVDAPIPRNSLSGALMAHRPNGISVIAEIKRRSPSKGWLAPDLDATATAMAYEQGGAVAISVLTDEPHFGGSLNDLTDVANAVRVPVLRKDFTVGPNDIVDAVEAGASAVLLIVAALSNDELAHLLEVARVVGIDALVEVHDLDEASRALSLGSTIIGVNQRDLHTFDVDTKRAESVVASLPRDVVAVAESGFSTSAAVERAAQVGFDAVLVGESLVTAPSPSEAVARFSGFTIGPRP